MWCARACAHCVFDLPDRWACEGPSACDILTLFTMKQIVSNMFKLWVEKSDAHACRIFLDFSPGSGGSAQAQDHACMLPWIFTPEPEPPTGWGGGSWRKPDFQPNRDRVTAALQFVSYNPCWTPARVCPAEAPDHKHC